MVAAAASTEGAAALAVHSISTAGGRGRAQPEVCAEAGLVLACRGASGTSVPEGTRKAGEIRAGAGGKSVRQSIWYAGIARADAGRTLGVGCAICWSGPGSMVPASAAGFGATCGSRTSAWARIAGAVRIRV